MSFTEICWLIIKICAGIIALFLLLGFTAKAIKARQDKAEKDDDGYILPTHG